MRADTELFEAWRNGDRKAGNDLFQRHFEAIERFFANKVDRDIEELVQETFARCVSASERFEGQSPTVKAPMTTLAAFEPHVFIGMLVIAWAMIKAWKWQYGPRHYTSLENIGLYWHLVDIIWIFLFPLLYLV